MKARTIVGIVVASVVGVAALILGALALWWTQSDAHEVLAIVRPKLAATASRGGGGVTPKHVADVLTDAYNVAHDAGLL